MGYLLSFKPILFPSSSTRNSCRFASAGTSCLYELLVVRSGETKCPLRGRLVSFLAIKKRVINPVQRRIYPRFHSGLRLLSSLYRFNAYVTNQDTLLSPDYARGCTSPFFLGHCFQPVQCLSVNSKGLLFPVSANSIFFYTLGYAKPHHLSSVSIS